MWDIIKTIKKDMKEDKIIKWVIIYGIFVVFFAILMNILGIEESCEFYRNRSSRYIPARCISYYQNYNK